MHASDGDRTAARREMLRLVTEPLQPHARPIRPSTASAETQVRAWPARATPTARRPTARTRCSRTAWVASAPPTSASPTRTAPPTTSAAAHPSTTAATGAFTRTCACPPTATSMPTVDLAASARRARATAAPSVVSIARSPPILASTPQSIASAQGHRSPLAYTRRQAEIGSAVLPRCAPADTHEVEGRAERAARGGFRRSPNVQRQSHADGAFPGSMQPRRTRDSRNTRRDPPGHPMSVANFPKPSPTIVATGIASSACLALSSW